MLNRVNEIKDTVVLTTTAVVKTLNDRDLREEIRCTNKRIKIVKLCLKRDLEAEKIVYQRRVKALKSAAKEKIVKKQIDLGIKCWDTYKAYKSMLKRNKPTYEQKFADVISKQEEQVCAAQ